MLIRTWRCLDVKRALALQPLSFTWAGYLRGYQSEITVSSSNNLPPAECYPQCGQQAGPPPALVNNTPPWAAEEMAGKGLPALG